MKVRIDLKVARWVSILIFVCVCVSGCVNLRAVTSGYIGCPQEEVTIVSGQRNVWTGTRNWVAECRGKKFYCSFVDTGYSAVADCTEEASETSNGGGSGCQYDSQCKGDRICESGVCVSP